MVDIRGIITSVVSGVTGFFTDFYNRYFKRKPQQYQEIPSSTTDQEQVDDQEDKTASGYEGRVFEEQYKSVDTFLEAMYNDDTVPREYKNAIMTLISAVNDYRVKSIYRQALFNLSARLGISVSKPEDYKRSIIEFIENSNEYNQIVININAYNDRINRRISNEEYKSSIVNYYVASHEFVEGVGLMCVVKAEFKIIGSVNNIVADQFERDFQFVIPMTADEYKKYY